MIKRQVHRSSTINAKSNRIELGTEFIVPEFIRMTRETLRKAFPNAENGYETKHTQTH